MPRFFFLFLLLFCSKHGIIYTRSLHKSMNAYKQPFEHEEREVFEMTEQAAAARRAYKREWARKNPEKVKQYQQNYWSRKAAETAAAETTADQTDTQSSTAADSTKGGAG